MTLKNKSLGVGADPCSCCVSLHTKLVCGAQHAHHYGSVVCTVSSCACVVQAARQAREFHNWRRLKTLEAEIAAMKAGQRFGAFSLPLQTLEKCAPRLAWHHDLI